MVQDEVRWLLETIKRQWPELAGTGTYGDGVYGDGLYFSETGGMPDHIRRIDRDDPEVLETGENTRSVELSRFAAIGVSEGDRPREPIGTEFHYDVQMILDVRIEASRGEISSKTEFKRLVRYAQAAISADRTYPTIEADDDIGYVHYEDARIENEQNRSHEYGDHWRVDFDVRLVGKQDPDRR